jgi:hypothetical protein
MSTAHARLVRKVIEHADVCGRAVRFPAIARTFPCDVLELYSERPPYYCHFMAWRLATLSNRQLCRFDELLAKAEQIPNWRKECRSFIKSAEYAEFWSLNWQLQVAEYLLDRGYMLSWMSEGPDLQATRNSATRYLECTVVRKHFAAALFVEELVKQCHSRLRLDSRLFLPRSMPKGADLEAFLNGLMAQLCEPGYIEELVERASKSYPVLVPLPNGSDNLVLYMDGTSCSAQYDPKVLPANAQGDIDNYLALVLRETIKNKQDANDLSNCRPNAVMINLFLGVDQQVAVSFGQANPDLGPNIDELLWASVGISAAISPETLNSAHGWKP